MSSNLHSLAVQNALNTFAAATGTTKETMATTIVHFMDALVDYIPEIQAEHTCPELKEIVAIITSQKPKSSQDATTPRL